MGWQCAFKRIGAFFSNFSFKMQIIDSLLYISVLRTSVHDCSITEHSPTKDLKSLASPTLYTLRQNSHESYSNNHQCFQQYQVGDSFPQASNFTWDLNKTTLPAILIPITLIAAFAVVILNALVVLAFQKKRELKKHPPYCYPAWQLQIFYLAQYLCRLISLQTY